jgi:membrane protease YdiL (CAAX protease family)
VQAFHHRIMSSSLINPLAIVFLMPSVVAMVVMRQRRRDWPHVLRVLGWRTSPPIWFAWAIAIALVTGGAAVAVVLVFAPILVTHPSPATTEYVYARMGLSVASVVGAFAAEAVFTTLGEEVFFRGLLGGWLVTRLGFQLGNAVQAIIFLAPHALLLAVNVHFWPVLVPQLAAGWLLGWLRTRSGSILPGWLAHTLVNTAGDVLAMVG